MPAKVNDWKEQTAFEREQWAKKRARIVKVARDEPDLSVAFLAERFGETVSAISKVLNEEGIRREPDNFAAYVHKRRRSA